MQAFLRKAAMTIGILLGILVILALVLLVLMPRAPKPPANLDSVAAMEAYLEEVVASEHPPGLSLTVVKDGEIVYANGFGLADGPRNVEAMEDTVYHWWSMTKIPTAIAIVQLEEQGLLGLDDPVSDYLPFFNVTYKGVATEVTIRQLLNHSSGVPDSMPEIFSWIHFEGDPHVNQTALITEKMPDYSELKFAPGSENSYSNVGYMVLGAIIEAVSGQTYEEYVIDNIITPQGMQSTSFVYTEEMAVHEAIGSQHVVNMFTPFFYTLGIQDVIRERVGMRYWLNRVYNDQTPPTGLIGPVTDFALFMIAYLNDGGEILQPESVTLMNSVLDELTSPKEELRWLGWIARLTEDGRRFLWHGGGGPGMQSLFRVYPDENLGVMVIGNHSTIDRERILDMLAGMAW